MMTDQPATRLSDAQLDELRVRARRVAGSLVDPAQLTRVTRFVAGRHAWAGAVLGKPFNLHRLTNAELVLLDLAAQAEPEPPVEPRPPAPWEEGYQPSERELAVAARAQARAKEWDRVRAALPVPVTVLYNYSGPHHYEFHVSGADHIIVREALDAGRLQRAADQSLCWTPSRARHLSFDRVSPESDRVPTCKACLRFAYRLVDEPPSEVLLAPLRR
ncbi:hypothetical protein [Actinophytocola sp.]|uniref:hypothetical protein n=1 Tax=Actinophytocola sp. TaxID=1872138 RepID=UPI002ED2397E